MKNFEGNADSRLTTSRVSVLLACANEAAFIVFLTWFLFQHADPRGDGMEMAGVGFAFMLIFLPFTLPAFIFARHGRWLVLAAGLAALAAVAYFGFWLETVTVKAATEGKGKKLVWRLGSRLFSLASHEKDSLRGEGSFGAGYIESSA
jgi:hypothetical protein